MHGKKNKGKKTRASATPASTPDLLINTKGCELELNLTTKLKEQTITEVQYHDCTLRIADCYSPSTVLCFPAQ